MHKKLRIIIFTSLIFFAAISMYSSMMTYRKPFIDIVEQRDYVAEVILLIDAFGGHLIIPLEEFKAELTYEPIYYLWESNWFNPNREDIKLEQGYVQLDTLIIAVNQLKEDYTYGHTGIQVTEKKGSFTLSVVGNQVLLVRNGYVYGEITELDSVHGGYISLKDSEKMQYDEFIKLLSERLK